MSNEDDLAVLADGIAELEDVLAQAPAGEDRAELEALLELARDTYTMVKARLEKRYWPRGGSVRPTARKALRLVG
jgi:hypothetical protein